MANTGTQDYILVTCGDDDLLAQTFSIDQADEAFAAAAERSAAHPYPVKVIEVDPGGRTVSTFRDGQAVSVESF